VGEPRDFAESLQQIDALVPVRILVHFLEGHNVGLGFGEHGTDAREIEPDALCTMEALIQRQAPPVGNVESNQGQPRHGGMIKDEGGGMKDEIENYEC